MACDQAIPATRGRPARARLASLASSGILAARGMGGSGGCRRSPRSRSRRCRRLFAWPPLSSRMRLGRVVKSKSSGVRRCGCRRAGVQPWRGGTFLQGRGFRWAGLLPSRVPRRRLWPGAIEFRCYRIPWPRATPRLNPAGRWRQARHVLARAREELPELERVRPRHIARRRCRECHVATLSPRMMKFPPANAARTERTTCRWDGRVA